MHDGLEDRRGTRCFSSGLSSQAISDFVYLWHAVRAVQLTDQPDKTLWRWTADGVYTAKSAYEMLHRGSIQFVGYKLVWGSWAPMKVKIFLWLALRRRHWTADRRQRHGLPSHTRCFLCDQADESIDHIIASCTFSREVWFIALSALNLTLPAAAAKTISWWRRLRSMVTGSKRKGMDSLFTLISWQLWKERNARCFRNGSSSIQELIQVIKLEADRWIQAGAAGLRDLAES